MGTSPPPAGQSGRSTRPKQPVRESSQPEISLHRAPVGRETLAAIDEELAHDVPRPYRPPLDTLDYDARPRPPSTSRPPLGSSPEVISIGEAPVGRATLAAIDEELAREAREALASMADLATETVPDLRQAGAPRPVVSPAQGPARPLVAPLPADIFEISTFIVEGEEIFSKASAASRRDFVEQRLLHRLPARTMNDVIRIDLSRGAAPNSVILRVWSRVGDPAG
jgi:hypothetical protein